MRCRRMSKSISHRFIRSVSRAASSPRAKCPSDFTRSVRHRDCRNCAPISRRERRISFNQGVRRDVIHRRFSRRSRRTELATLPVDQIERAASILAETRSAAGGFSFRVGGSAGNASHAVNDFRKIAGFEAYAPTDNVSELTARVNDEGWDDVFSTGSRAAGSSQGRAASCSRSAAATSRRTSAPIWCARSTRQAVGATIVGMVGRDGGYTARRRRLRDRPDRQRRARHAAHRSVPGGRVAPARLAPGDQGAQTKWESVQAPRACAALNLFHDFDRGKMQRERRTRRPARLCTSIRP